MDTIVEIVEKRELSNPAIIILGEVVNHRAILSEVKQDYSRVLMQ